jgi:hypothetical protein
MWTIAKVGRQGLRDTEHDIAPPLLKAITIPIEFDDTGLRIQLAIYFGVPRCMPASAVTDFDLAQAAHTIVERLEAKDQLAGLREERDDLRARYEILRRERDKATAERDKATERLDAIEKLITSAAQWFRGPRR